MSLATEYNFNQNKLDFLFLIFFKKEGDWQRMSNNLIL